MKKAKAKPEPKPTIAGTWKLLDLHGRDLTGEITYPFEMDARGICFFDDQNNFSMQYNAPDRPRLSRQDPYYCKDPEIRIDYLSGRAYYGKYQLDSDTVYLHFHNSSFSNLSGLTMKYVYLTRGDSLQLISPKMRLNGQVINEYSLWYLQGFKPDPKASKIKTSMAKFRSWLDDKFKKSKLSNS